MQLTDRDKRILQIAGIVLPLLLIVYFFFLRPDDGQDLAAPPTGPTGVQPTETASPTASPSATPRTTLPPVSLAGGRDPFSIPPGLEGAGGGVGPTSEPTTPGETETRTTFTTPPFTTPPFTTPPITTPPTTTTTTSPPPPPERPGHKIEIGGHTVKLTHVAANGKKVNVKVDGKEWTVEPGAIFDDNFKLVKIDGKCAVFLFGDQKFELCEKKKT